MVTYGNQSAGSLEDAESCEVRGAKREVFSAKQNCDLVN